MNNLIDAVINGLRNASVLTKLEQVAGYNRKI